MGWFAFSTWVSKLVKTVVGSVLTLKAECCLLNTKTVFAFNFIVVVFMPKHARSSQESQKLMI